MDYIISLVFKSLSTPLEGQELAQLEEWLNASPKRRAWYQDLQDGDRLAAMLGKQAPAQLEVLESELYERILTGTGLLRKPRVIRWRIWTAAAAVMLLLGLGTYLLRKPSPKTIVAVAAAEIKPGQQGAVLTLADGSQVSLDTVRNAVIALQGGVTARVVNGTLIYEGQGNAVVYNTMSTPRGREFQLTLPDGTQVWLNSASSIHYPTAFTGNERKVDISGEAYFEVTQNADMPFRVNVAGKAEMKVLGTHFNVSAYDNEASINATLLEGSVAVMIPGARQVVLQPGEQARVTDKITVIRHADTEKVMAWKNGFFNFDGLTLQQIMRQLERWYDIDVTYEGPVPDIELSGEMTRGVTLNGLLKNLKELGVHYKLEGRKLTVLP